MFLKIQKVRNTERDTFNVTVGEQEGRYACSVQVNFGNSLGEGQSIFFFSFHPEKYMYPFHQGIMGAFNWEI